MKLGLNQQEVANTGDWTREIQGYIMEIEDYVHYILIWEKGWTMGIHLHRGSTYSEKDRWNWAIIATKDSQNQGARVGVMDLGFGWCHASEHHRSGKLRIGSLPRPPRPQSSLMFFTNKFEVRSVKIVSRPCTYNSFKRVQMDTSYCFHSHEGFMQLSSQHWHPRGSAEKDAAGQLRIRLTRRSRMRQWMWPPQPQLQQEAANVCNPDSWGRSRRCGQTPSESCLRGGLSVAMGWRQISSIHTFTHFQLFPSVFFANLYTIWSV